MKEIYRTGLALLTLLSTSCGSPKPKMTLSSSCEGFYPVIIASLQNDLLEDHLR